MQSLVGDGGQIRTRTGGINKVCAEAAAPAQVGSRDRGSSLMKIFTSPYRMFLCAAVSISVPYDRSNCCLIRQCEIEMRGTNCINQ